MWAADSSTSADPSPRPPISTDQPWRIRVARAPAFSTDQPWRPHAPHRGASARWARAARRSPQINRGEYASPEHLHSPQINRGDGTPRTARRGARRSPQINRGEYASPEHLHSPQINRGDRTPLTAAPARAGLEPHAGLHRSTVENTRRPSTCILHRSTVETELRPIHPQPGSGTDEARRGDLSAGSAQGTVTRAGVLAPEIRLPRSTACTS